ncbi:winged helix-turn-helix domain-containing protein (plasmid) [Paenibacillus urinalis]|uniref:Winged helix-turn-helix domain-containing protein n=2 Tax=Bacillota TaxID=1239 RepID=A0ABY7XHY6_9BACL|nr:winged helix-turn-helix domain-containing protein [Paenibacillus urinalis]WDI00125.1 winged helix-turn-helix domain-containing protein [Paenibacillus urinalis]WDI00138.1 winged helix-turn-helix domain-containing protein [Paenibacillus urinalis]WDI05436.1 winged helix-turn-helix domain-containing protein [Paenibacillus urinalis]
MGIFSQLDANRESSVHDLLARKGITLEFQNNLESVPLDAQDSENMALIKRIFNSVTIRPTKIDMIIQRDAMYNNARRFICVLNRNNETGGGYQDLYGFNEFERERGKYIGESEKMISFSTFYSKHPAKNGAVRTPENIFRTSVFAQDIDAGKDGMPIEEQLRRLHGLVIQNRVPLPNKILFSGTGIQPFWFTESLMMKVGSKVYQTWEGIQRAIFAALDEAGLKPDPAVFNPSHNTRMVETINERAGGKLVRGYVLHTERKRLGFFINHYFTALHDVFKAAPVKKSGSKVVKSPKFWNQHSYAWGMIQDMNLIPELKVREGETIVGLQWRWRMATIVRFFAWIYWDDETMALKQVEEWWMNLPASEQEGTTLKEIMRRSKTADRYYLEFKQQMFDKKKYKQAGLFYKNETLVKELQLSVNIQLQLNIIKIRSYKDKSNENKTGKKWDTEYERTRNTIRRKEQGVSTHADKKRAKIEAITAALAANPNATVREIASKTGISVGSVQNYIKKIKGE